MRQQKAWRKMCSSVFGTWKLETEPYQTVALCADSDSVTHQLTTSKRMPGVKCSIIIITSGKILVGSLYQISLLERFVFCKSKYYLKPKYICDPGL